jgi:hypothetical protein
MKNLNKRTKILMAIAGGVVVVGVLVIAIFQPPLNELFGTSQVQLIPYTSTISIGQTIALQMPGGANCNWSNGDQRISFVNNVKTGTSVTVKGASSGQAQVIATCGSIVGVGLVNVLAPTPTPTMGPLRINPLNPMLNVGVAYMDPHILKLTAVNAKGSCEWTYSPSPAYTNRLSSNEIEIGIANFQLSAISGPFILTATAKCGSESASTKITTCNGCPGSIPQTR